MKRMDNPNGMNDRLIEESRILSEMELAICENLSLCGYEKISTPLIEYCEVFSKNEFFIDEDSIYKFIDRDGSIMVLRPDLTIPCARVAATKMKNYQKPLKLFYTGNVYRIEGEGSNARKELNQIGAEIYGDSGIWSDIETIITCCDCIIRSGVKDFKIDIGYEGFFDGLSKAVGLSVEVEGKLRKLMNEKNMNELEIMVESLDMKDQDKQLLLKLPYIFGNPKKVFNELKSHRLEGKAKESVNYLKNIIDKLQASPYKDNVNIDMSMVSNMRYYTGVIFRGYANGAGGAIFSGGRYDTLTNIFHSNDQAVGFALYMDQILSAMKSQNILTSKVEKYLILFDEDSFEKATLFAENLRLEKKIASLLYIKSLSEEAAYLKDFGFTKVFKFIEGVKTEC